MSHKKIKRLFSNFKTHQSAFAVVFSLAGKAVRTIQITRMRDMQAQRLHHARAPLFQRSRHALIRIGRKQFPRRFQILYRGKARVDLLRRRFARLPVFFEDPFSYLAFFRGFVHADDVVSNLVHHMDGAGIGIEDDVQSSQFITMNHKNLL